MTKTVIRAWHLSALDDTWRAFPWGRNHRHVVYFQRDKVALGLEDGTLIEGSKRSTPPPASPLEAQPGFSALRDFT